MFADNNFSRCSELCPCTWLLLAVLVCAPAATGCRNVASSAYNVEGVQLYQQGNYQQASDRFQKAIAKDPNSADGYYNLAASLHKTGTLYNRPNDLRQAELLYNQCLERDDSHTDCHRGLAVLLTETGRQQQAFQLLDNWKSTNPQAADPKIELARLHEEFGQYEQSKAQLVDALASDPHNARALTALGKIRDQEGDYAQAIANYQRSLEVNRFQPQIASRIATLQGAMGVPSMAAQTTPANPRVAQPWQPATRY